MFRICLTLLTLACACPAGAGLFDDPKNLQVLPEDISPGRLRDTMRNFSQSTGLRCNGCHVGEGDDFSTFDFPADDKDTKKVARKMLTIQRDLNARLAEELGTQDADLVKVTCMTCHRGVQKPRMLQAVLEETYSEQGLAATKTRYRELRDQYYGSHSYDFGEASLIDVAMMLARQNQIPAALELLDLNLEFHPDSMQSLARQGQMLGMAGEAEAARAKFNQALEISPGNPWIQQLLDNLDTRESTQ